MCKSFSSLHCATIWPMLKGSGYCCSHCQKCWEGEGRKVSHSLLGFSTCLFLQFLKFLNVLNAQGTKNCLWSFILCSLREQLWEDTAGKHGGECGADPSTATRRPHVCRESSRKCRSLDLEHRSQACCNRKEGVEKRRQSVCFLVSEQNGFNLAAHMLTGLCPHPECTKERPHLFTFLM